MKKKTTKRRATLADLTTAYATSVASGEIVAGPLVRAACDRHLKDLEQAAARGWIWDVTRATRAQQFFPDILRLNGGEFEGKPFHLAGWEQFIIGSLFGWVGDQGHRRYQVAYLEIGKGNGKSPLAAGIGLYMLVADGEARAEVYAAATKKDQAMILFRDAVAMVDLSPELNKRLIKTGGQQAWNLSHIQSGSFFRAISSDDGQSGPRPHCALIDEIHEHTTDMVVEMMRAGFKGRRQPLMVMITNSGFDRETVCWTQHQYGERIVTGQIEDDRYFTFICSLDDGEDPFEDESCWIKANPNLGISIQPQYLCDQVREASGMPSKASRVRRLNFCEWVDAENPWISREIWVKCEAWFDIEDLAGEEAIGGLDLSGSKDLTALSLFFPKQRKAFVEFWTPGETLRDREKIDKVPYSVWRDAGHLHATPGRTVDYSFVASRLAELQSIFQISRIAFDPYRIKYFEAELEALGIAAQLVPHPQGFYRGAQSNLWMPRSVELLEDAVGKGTIAVKKNPVLTWNASSAVLERDAKENAIFTKRKSKGRIDGIVALAMAVGAGESELEPQKMYQMMFV